jgi:ankyrin repeat protein
MLHIATSAAQKEIVKLLLQSGADVNTPWTQARVTAIHLAAVYGQASLLELFKQYGADFLVTTAEGETALHLAAKVRHSAEAMTTLTSFLTEQGCSINTQDKGGNTALHEAAKAGNGIAVQALLKLNADRALTNLEGKKAAELTTDASLVALLED